MENKEVNQIKEPVYVGDWIRFSYIRRFLKKVDGGTLLDVGAGQMEYKELCESKGYTYSGIDIDPKSPAQRGDILNIPFGDEQFDVVLCVDVMEHIKDHNKAIRELMRVLKTDGILILHVPNKYQRHILFDKPDEDNHDHAREGYDPIELNTLFYEFKKVTHYPTFDKLESVAWDLSYVARNKKQVNPWNILKNDTWTNYGWLVIAKK